MIPRLKLELILRNVRQAKIAEDAKVSRAFINRVVNEKQKASPKVVRALKKHGIEVGE